MGLIYLAENYFKYNKCYLTTVNVLCTVFQGAWELL